MRRGVKGDLDSQGDRGSRLKHGGRRGSAGSCIDASFVATDEGNSNDLRLVGTHWFQHCVQGSRGKSATEKQYKVANGLSTEKKVNLHSSLFCTVRTLLSKTNTFYFEWPVKSKACYI